LRSAGDVKQSNLVRQPDGTVAFTIDFVGKDMSKMAENSQVAPQVSVGKNADVVEQSVRYNPVTKGWRLVLRLRVKDAKQSTEMRAALVSGDKTLTETWSYQLPANE
ncbi:MAG: glucan biosynthesis protein, partial [Pantoea agglomerans]